MAIGHLLRDFCDSVPQQTSENGQSLTTRQYDLGYQAGWDEALSHAEKTNLMIGAQLARNLQDLTFTFAEARQATISEFDEVVELLVEKILPKIAHETLGLQIIDQLRESIFNEEHPQIQVVASPQDAPTIESVLESVPGVSTQVQIQADLPAGAVLWRMNEAEHQVDVPKLIQGIEKTLRGYVYEAKGEQKHA